MCRYGLRERSIQTGRSNINTRKPVYKHSASGVRLCRVFVLLKVALRPQRLILTFIKETAERAPRRRANAPTILFCCLHLVGCRTANMLSEIPLMTFRVFGAIAAVSVELVLRLLDDLHLVGCRTANMLSEIPLMTFRVFGAIAAVSVELVLRLLDDLRPCLFCRVVMLVHIVDYDVKALGYLPEVFRVLIVWSRVAHHHHGVAQLHRRVSDVAIRTGHARVLAKAEGSRQPIQRPGNIFVIEIDGDSLLVLFRRHSSVLLPSFLLSPSAFRAAIRTAAKPVRRRPQD